MKKLFNLLILVICFGLFWAMFFFGVEKDAEYQEYRNEQICKLYNCKGE